ncbi:chromate transporter [Bordetella ansorpii]|uniref:Chromate transporter n=1 Tax=Bordetella ansorpii TaxID=288768 RepID=A0A157SGC3_9BORD|nr:chromate transporter [Bordetella ansorpii]SAI69243.1 chromate transporter [Bordetella ansorpii]
MDLPEHSQAPDTAPPPTRLELFLGFLTLGMTAFGGALPLARSMVVERRRWLSGLEFSELLGLCQFLPGGNIINMSVAIGMKFRGPSGAFAALMGLIAVPTAVVIMLGVVYDRYSSDPHVQHVFAGLAAAAAGLLVAMAVKIVMPLRRSVVGLLLALAGCLAIAVLRLPLLPTMLVLTPVSVLLVRRPGK